MLQRVWLHALAKCLSAARRRARLMQAPAWAAQQRRAPMTWTKSIVALDLHPLQQPRHPPSPGALLVCRVFGGRPPPSLPTVSGLCLLPAIFSRLLSHSLLLAWQRGRTRWLGGRRAEAGEPRLRAASNAGGSSSSSGSAEARDLGHACIAAGPCERGGDSLRLRMQGAHRMGRGEAAATAILRDLMAAGACARACPKRALASSGQLCAPWCMQKGGCRRGGR